MQVTQVTPFQVEVTGQEHWFKNEFQVCPLGQTIQAHPFQNCPLGQTHVEVDTFQTLPLLHLSTQLVPFHAWEAKQTIQVFPLKKDPVGQ